MMTVQHKVDERINSVDRYPWVRSNIKIRIEQSRRATFLMDEKVAPRFNSTAKVDPCSFTVIVKINPWRVVKPG